MPRQVGSIGKLLLISPPQLFHVWVGLNFIKGRRRVGKILLCTAFPGRCNERRTEIGWDDALAVELAQSIVPADLRAALIATAKKRGTEKYLADAPAAFDEVEADPNMEKLWQAYQKKFSYAADLSWHTVVESIRSLYRLARAE